MQKQLRYLISQTQAWQFKPSFIALFTLIVSDTVPTTPKSKSGAIKLLSLLLFCISIGGNLQASSLYIGKPESPLKPVPEPVIIVESQTNILLDELSKRKDEFDKEPQKLVTFARNVALSHWNFRKTSRIMLGIHWKKSTLSQKERFTEEFLRTILRYVVKAYGYYDDSLVSILSYDWKASSKKGGWVRSVIRLPAGLKVSVDYRMDLNKADQWKMIDVRVEGISLVNSKRTEYRNSISQNGVESLLNTMSDKNQKVLAK